VDAAALRLLGVDHSPTAIDLSVGEADFETPRAIREAAVQALMAGETRYTPRLGLPELREAVCVRLERKKDYRPCFEDAVITAGASPAVCISIAAVCRSGDTILVPDPAWPNYQMFANRIGVGCRRYGFRASVELDLDELEALIDTTTRLVVVNSPANPTGALATRGELERLVAIAERRGIWILSDEAYDGIVFEGERAWSPCAVGGLERTFAAYTFSKTYAMTGWRVGYLVAPAAFRRAVLELQATMTGCAPAMAQRAAVFALEHGASYAETMRLAYEQRRDAALQQLRGTDLVDGVPRGAFYLWLTIDRTGMSGLELTQWLAREADVLVSAGEVYSDGSAPHVRVAFAVSDESLRRGLAAIRSAVGELRAGAAAGAGTDQMEA
jgi:aspartate aminotransferase